MKEELLKELDFIQTELKDYNKFIHLLSDDEGKQTLARLYAASKKVGLLLSMNELKDVAFPENDAIQKPLFGETGALVSIRPCAKEYGDKTYIGFLIGEVALGSSITIKEDKIQLNFSGHNPAIYVPELKKIIYGCASWWGEIKYEEDFKKITDEDIQNVWYVKLWKSMLNSDKNDEPSVATEAK